MLKVDYLKNEKSFRSETKKYFFLFRKCSLLDIIKQASKYVADTTFQHVWSFF